MLQDMLNIMVFFFIYFVAEALSSSYVVEFTRYQLELHCIATNLKSVPINSTRTLGLINSFNKTCEVQIAQ